MSLTTFFWVIVLRLGEVIAAAGLTIVIGCLIAAVMHRLIGRERMRALFAGSAWASFLKAWGLGMLLPVCSLGTIPVMREMKRAGISAGTVLAFGLTAPLFNPVSVVYGLTLASPWVVIVFTLCSLVIVSVVGIVFDWLFPSSEIWEPQPTIPPGLKRMISVLESALRQLTGFNLACLLIGIAGSVGLSLVLPHGFLQGTVEPDLIQAPLNMLSVAVPMFLSPIAAMVQIAGMFEHGNSVGAAFTMLIVGAGLNLGTLWWILRTYGWGSGLRFLAMLFAVVLALAYSVDRPLYPVGVKPVGHTHAFDQFCFPVPEGYELTGELVAVQLKRLYLEVHVLAGAIAFGLFLLAGQLLALIGREDRWLAWFMDSRREDWKYDTYLSNQVLVGVTFAGLVAASVIGCYVYYPPKDSIFDELQSVNIRLGSAVLSSNWQEATALVSEAEDWTNKLVVSSYLRGRERTEFQLAKTNVFMENLERLEHAVEGENAEKARKYALQLQTDLRRMRTAWE